MDFRTAVEGLAGCVTRQEIAEALGVSFYSVKQALLPTESAAHRSPPPGWEVALVKLAKARGKELGKLVEQLERGSPR